MRTEVKSYNLLLIALVAAPLLAAKPVKADEVFSPYITEHEWELETEGIATTHDKDTDKQAAKDIETSVEYSPTAWWRTEFEGEFEREGGPDAEPIHYESFNWLNTISLAEPGEFWFDPAVFIEFDNTPGHQDPNNVIFGLIGAKQVGDVLTTVNLFGHKEYGPNAGPIAGFAYSNQTKYLWKTWLQPGFEVFGDTDGQTKFQDQQLAVGPGIFGKIFDGPGRAIKYEASYLFGATQASPSQAVRWKLEYEFFL